MPLEGEEGLENRKEKEIRFDDHEESKTGNIMKTEALQKLKLMNECMTHTEDAFIDTLKESEEEKSETIRRFVQFFTDQLNLFLHSLPNTSQTEKSEMDERRRPMIQVDDKKRDRIKMDPIKLSTSSSSDDGTSDIHQIDYLSDQWDWLEQIRETEVSDFIRKRFGTTSSSSSLILFDQCKLFDLHPCIPHGRSIDNLVLVGPALNPSGLPLKSLPYKYQQMISKIVPPVDQRLSADLKAWKELIETSSSTTGDKTLRTTQLIDEKNFRETNLSGKQFVPTTDTVRYLIEYLSLAMIPGQKTTVVICSYFSHLDSHDVGCLSDDKNEEWEGEQILLSDFISATTEEEGLGVEVNTIPVRSLLNLSQLMKKGTELEIVLDAGGAGIEAFWGATRAGGRSYLDELEKTARVVSSKAVRGGVVTVKRFLPLELRNRESGCGQRDIDLYAVVKYMKSKRLRVKCNFK